MAMNRTIRRSQAIHPYGPGAILDWGQECFVVLDTRKGGWARARKIYLKRLERHLNVDGFRVPPVANEFGGGIGISTLRFPSWLFCPRCRRMRQWRDDDERENRGKVPICSNDSCQNSVLVPMRYVAVCENGHLTDVDWWRWVHSRTDADAGSCDRGNKKLRFEARSDKGSSLEALVVKCENCNSSRDLSEIGQSRALERIGQTCFGRQPWQPYTEEESCDEPLLALLRSQTAVHFADTPSALDLTAEEDPSDQEFEEAMIEVAIDGLGTTLGLNSAEDFEQHIESIVGRVSDILNRPIQEVAEEGRSWLNDHFANDTAPEEASILEGEWPALTTPTSSQRSSIPLIVSDRDWPAENEADQRLRSYIDSVYLVERLRVVKALAGFCRVKSNARSVPPNLGIPGRPNWMPATEVYGEGIFVRFSNGALENWETREGDGLEERMTTFRERIEKPERIASRFQPELTVLSRFVMIHTFAHLLMRQLCYECGYSAASIRERVYVFPDRAGVLIYTADGDSEGSLGGLVRQGREDRLGPTILSSLERSAWCSNDPICRELPPHGMDGLNRAACHACVLVAETSCTHMNSLLDRELVIGEGSPGVRGFFRDLVD